MNDPITVEAKVNAPIEKVWRYWTEPEHITNWNHASDDWECPSAENDVRENGEFKIAMSAKDGSQGFDFEGTYTRVVLNELIEYLIADGRKVSVKFESLDGVTKITEVFEQENTYSREMQEQGWQAILDNFKHYAESN